MEILEMKTTVYREVALNWLHLWNTDVSDGVKSVHINYEQMYAEIVGEIPMFKVFETLSEIPKNDEKRE